MPSPCPISNRPAATCRWVSTKATGKKTASTPSRRQPTFAALRLMVNNWRWRNVPFYLRSGKAMAAPFQRSRHPVPLPAALDVPVAG